MPGHEGIVVQEVNTHYARGRLAHAVVDFHNQSALPRHRLRVADATAGPCRLFQGVNDEARRTFLADRGE